MKYSGFRNSPFNALHTPGFETVPLMHEILQVSKLGTDNVTQESGAVLGLKLKTTLCCSDMQITREGGGGGESWGNLKTTFHKIGHTG